MNRIMKVSACCLALLFVTAITFANPCAAQTTSRPLSDFLSAQGTTSNFTPPIPDFWGWYDNPGFIYFAAVDYAGLAANYLATHGGPNLGTVITGGITETVQPDGTVEVTVTLNARNALAWACPASEDWATFPTVFGSRAITLLTNPNAPIALVNSQLKITFINPAPGAPLPDMSDFWGPRYPDLRNVTYSSNGSGPLSGGGNGRLKIVQTGLMAAQGKGPNWDGWPAEIVTIK